VNESPAREPGFFLPIFINGLAGINVRPWKPICQLGHGTSVVGAHSRGCRLNRYLIVATERSRQALDLAGLVSASSTTAMVRNTLDGLTLIESMPSPVK
jgi:hypothetical protein